MPRIYFLKKDIRKVHKILRNKFDHVSFKFYINFQIVQIIYRFQTFF